MVGGGDAYRPAESCPVASEKYGGGGYMSHMGDPSSFLVALAKVHDDSAAVRLSVWSCVFCGTTLVGLGDPDEPVGDQDFTWMQR
jgi:hypothetical protein